MWLTQLPQPRPPRETWDDDPVYVMLKQGFEQHHAENPEMAGIHYMTADTVEECWQLLRQSLTTAAYPALAHVPDVQGVAAGGRLDPGLRALPAQPAADRAQRPRQAVGAEEPQPPRGPGRADEGLPRRARRADAPRPGDVRRLGVLARGDDDAGLVDGVRRASSSAPTCSTCCRPRRGCFAEARSRLRPRAVRRRRVRRPRRPTRSASSDGVYDAFDLPWDDAVESAVADEHAASQAGPRAPRHEYALADYGLTEEQVRAAF